MIGYVQIATPAEWRDCIQEALRDAPLKYEVVEPVEFLPLGIGVPEPVFYSEHSASSGRAGKRITHALIQCA